MIYSTTNFRVLTAGGNQAAVGRVSYGVHLVQVALLLQLEVLRSPLPHNQLSVAGRQRQPVARPVEHRSRQRVLRHAVGRKCGFY